MVIEQKQFEIILDLAQAMNKEETLAIRSIYSNGHHIEDRFYDSFNNRYICGRRFLKDLLKGLTMEHLDKALKDITYVWAFNRLISQYKVQVPMIREYFRNMRKGVNNGKQN